MESNMYLALCKRIKIEKPHFRFYYILPGKEPWAIADGNEKRFPIRGSQLFIILVEREGSQAKAAAISIGKKYASELAATVRQGELIPKA